MTLDLNRPSDEQLRSAADRIRRLSAGISDPEEESADLSTFAEEAVRRAYRIQQLGVDFWASLLRLDPGLDEAGTVDAWTAGRCLGATIRGQGDLKNAKRGRLWFDSSPLLGPKVEAERSKQEQGLVPVPRLLTVSAARKVMDIFDLSRGKDDVERSFWLGLWSGALERELRNPQARSGDGRLDQDNSVIAFLLERDPDESPNVVGGSLKGALEESRTASITLADRLLSLFKAQGGRDIPWRPLYSFLRRGDVIVITLAREGIIASRTGAVPGGVSSESDAESRQDGSSWGSWGFGWESGVPIALAVVTAPTNWDRAGWWGRIGSVLMLGHPRWIEQPNEMAEAESGGQGTKSGAPTLEKIRTAFRFPSAEARELRLSFGLREPESEDEKSDHSPFKTTNDLALERMNRYERWLKKPDSLDDRRFDPELIQPIPAGFPGPWRRLDRADLRATLGEFLEFHTWAVRAFEQRTWPPGETYDDEAGYQANLDIERFALTSDNVRLGVFFDNPVRSKGRASAQRIAPDPLPDLEMLSGIEEEDGLTKKERERIEAANIHRRMFDLYKRGLRGDFSASDQTRADRAASYMPAMRLDPSIISGQGVGDFGVFPRDGNEALWEDRTFLIWNDTLRESEWEEEPGDRLDPVDTLVDSIGRLLGSSTEPRTFCAVFLEREREDLDRATFSRAFRKEGLAAEDGMIPIDPAGTRMRDCVLITSKKSESQLLIVLTDDSVAAADLGAIIWLLLAYDELEEEHVLDVKAHALFLEDSTTDPKAKRKLNFTELAEERRRKAWEILTRSRPKSWSK